MAEKDVHSHIFKEEDPTLDLDIKTEIRFSKKNLPKGEMVPVFVDGRKEYVLIPLDIKDGTTLTVRGGGKHNPRSGRTGDLHVLVHISEDRQFPWNIGLMAVVAFAAVIAVVYLISKKPISAPEPTTELAEVSCTHSWMPADCTTPKTCSECGETTGEAVGHKWSEATCTSPKTCEVCGEISGTALKHEWQEATYDAPKMCTICGATEGIALEKPSIKVDDIVTFGNYEQDGLRKNGAEPIEWIVLDVQGDRALLLSRYALDSQPYNNYGMTTWEQCELRNWLNSTFWNAAFTEDEQHQIIITEVDNSISQCNIDWHFDGGNNTEDAIFLLSYADTDRYFDDPADRICTPTNYAVAMGADTRILDDGITVSGWWWLRSPGEWSHHAAFVNFDGTRYSNAVGNGYLSVRPALWINLDGE